MSEKMEQCRFCKWCRRFSVKGRGDDFLVKYYCTVNPPTVVNRWFEQVDNDELLSILPRVSPSWVCRFFEQRRGKMEELVDMTVDEEYEIYSAEFLAEDDRGNPQKTP